MKKVCLVSSSGGHLEQLRQLKPISDKYESFFVVPKSKSTIKMKEKKYLVNDLNRKSKIKYFLGLFKMIYQAFVIIINEKPDIIISTGAGAAIPMCILGKIFKKKLIYIESFARIDTPNKTGKLLYYFADLFIIQWEELRPYYPKAIYGGWIY